MDVAAELKNITYKYGDHVALSDISFTLKRGEVIALLGPNGAGKTTAVKLLLGLLAVQHGEANIFGANPRLAATRARTGTMLQVARTPETVKVREFLQLFRSYYPNPMSMEQIISRARLQGFENELFGALSGGQRQRALFGLAIAGNPDMVFLDEPTLGMDIEARHALWAEVRRLRDEGKTVLLTTHYLEEADALADRIIVIRSGKVVGEGTPAQIKAGVAGKRIRCKTTIHANVLRGIPSVSTVQQDGMATTLRTTDAESVLRFMLLHDETLSDLEVSAPALEEAFLALTAEEKEEVVA